MIIEDIICVDRETLEEFKAFQVSQDAKLVRNWRPFKKLKPGDWVVFTNRHDEMTFSALQDYTDEEFHKKFMTGSEAKKQYAEIGRQLGLFGGINAD
jgi:hypothetical protein